MGYLEGISMSITSLKEKEWISAGSTEMTPLEQRCKDRHYSEVQTLKTSELSLHCSLFPAVWLRYKFFVLNELLGILPLISGALASEVSRISLLNVLCSPVLMCSMVRRYHAHNHPRLPACTFCGVQPCFSA